VSRLGVVETVLPALWQLTSHTELIPEVLQSSPNMASELVAMIAEASRERSSPKSEQILEAALGVCVNLSSRVEGRPVLMQATSPAGEPLLDCAVALMHSEATSPQQAELVLALVGNISADPAYVTTLSATGVINVIANVFTVAGSRSAAQDFESLDEIDIDAVEKAHAWERIRDKVHNVVRRNAPHNVLTRTILDRAHCRHQTTPRNNAAANPSGIRARR
jgi:hypothetical protein